VRSAPASTAGGEEEQPVPEGKEKKPAGEEAYPDEGF